MATREFNDGKPTYWTLKFGRHNALSRHRGEHGLWYLVGTWGQGRWMDRWSIAIFPDSVTISGYAGARASRIMTDALMSHCLLEVSGKGGRDFGKSAMSKGGFRPMQDIPYRFEGEEFDPALLQDGDEFVRQVLGYEPTPQGVREGAARDEARREREAAEKKAAEEARKRAWEEKMERERAARVEAQTEFEAMFEDVELPEGFFCKIDHNGLKVWRDHGEEYGHRRYYDQRTLTSVEAFEAWKQEAEAKLREEAEKAERWAKERARREAEKKAREAEIAAQEAAIAEQLDELDNLLGNL